MQLFTKNQLKELATPASFQRGKEYYEEGYVRKISPKGNIFEGTVEGSYRYRLKMEVQGGKLSFQCSCPYDYEGICKHCIAFGLAILAEEYTETTRYAQFAEDAQIVPGNTPDISFEEQFNSIDNQIKLLFLQQVLNKDIHLRSQFLHFIQSQKTSDPAPSSPVSFSDMIRNHMRESLSSLEFDEQMYSEYGDSYNDYYGEGEELYDMTEEIIGEVLQPQINEAQVLLRQGKLLESSRIIFYVYEGIRQVEAPYVDEYSLFDGVDYQDFVLRVLDKLLKVYLAEIKKVVVPVGEVYQTFNLLIDRYLYYETTYNKLSNDLQVLYELKHFEQFLLMLSYSPETALFLQQLLEKHNLTDTDTAHIMLQIAEVTNNETLWLQTAEDFAPYASDITFQLLDKYRSKSERQHLIRVARAAYLHEPLLVDEYIITHITPEEDKELYLKAVEFYTRRKQSIAHYRILQKYFTAQQRTKFIQAQEKGYNPLFYVQLLEAEGHYQQILEVLKKYKNQEVPDFGQMLATIAHLFPNECMDLVMEKIEYTMQTDRRGRHTYQQITSWLKVLKSRPSLDGQLNIFCQYLYDHNSRLRALREELQYAGLVRKK